MATKHDAEYFRARRRARNVPERDPFHSPRMVARGKELAAMMAVPDLAWPTSLYGNQPATIAELMAVKDKDKDDLCICGKPHRQNVPWTRRSTTGMGFSIVYSCSNACKSLRVRNSEHDRP